MVGYPRVPAGRLVVERSRRRSRGPARHQTLHRLLKHVAVDVLAKPASATQSDNLSFKRQGMTGRSMPCLLNDKLSLWVARSVEHCAVWKTAQKSALDGFGCPTEAPYGCFLPDLTRFGTCRHPNPSNALGARYILPAPARWGKVANLGRSFFDYSGNRIGK